jgi:hypothetical protein
MTAETIPPAYAVGDRVTFERQEGEIASVYPGSGAPMWWGSRRLIHTHNYAVKLAYSRTIWGVVDAELSAVKPAKPYTYRDFVSGKTRRTFGVFESWQGPTGPLGAFYAVFRTPKTAVCVPEYALSAESRQRLPKPPKRTPEPADGRGEEAK